ncbi:hypothetical protein MNBD_ACTINO02-1316 [hydrothermal vent metagenome]|uniref:Pentapeptide repeat family protein n=1 Tax=hydrothermal vent metagenome TaxID=652676 RepID=A0A3B0RXX3_9ZZZZ
MRIVCQTGEVIDVSEPLEGSRFRGLNLHRAILERVSFEGVVFESCNLRSALFALSSGVDARFIGCTLVLAGFQAADLRGAWFEASDAYSCDFTGANLAGARFVSTRLELASFRGCSLDGADLTKTDLAGALLEGALYTPKTRWPAGFDPTACGAVLVGEQQEIFGFLVDGEAPPDGE